MNRIIGLVGDAVDRERFAYEAQSRHGFSVAYSVADLGILRTHGGRCLLLGVDEADLDRVRSIGTLVFVSSARGCQPGDYVFLQCSPGDGDYSIRVSDLIWAVAHEDDSDAPAQAETA
ncbi:MAG: hypothetical protein KZQ95_01880 [Candidatus Thiodiazotropha sp. (ex Epidulcina cf. delphinae)]|nr:hypothetical protein [Candidatus Thiodiazotropha sp. (ex Epidulcina cf. delphinae)]